MKSPYSNPYLSMRARGLFAYYEELGRVVSADELSAVMPEGRDAVQGAINELRRANYIRTTREWNGTKWISTMKFTKEAEKSNPKVLNTGFSGLLYVCSCTATVDNTNHITTNDNTKVELLRNSTLLGAALPTKGIDMPWNLDGEETPDGEFVSKSQMRRVRIQQEIDDTPGAVGKVVDKKAMRREKYGPKPVTHRNNKPEELWDTADLVAEFGSLLGSSSAGHLTMQLNTRSLALWINQQVGRGATRQNMLSAIRMFFEDPRNLNDAGTGTPVWRRFIGYYQTVEGSVTREELEDSYDKDLIKAQQEKMLRLLGGK